MVDDVCVIVWQLLDYARMPWVELCTRNILALKGGVITSSFFRSFPLPLRAQNRS